jgi:hypothetical protein
MNLDQIEKLMCRIENGEINLTSEQYKDLLKATHSCIFQMLSILDDNIGRDDDPHGVLKDIQHEYVSVLYSNE